MFGFAEIANSATVLPFKSNNLTFNYNTLQEIVDLGCNYLSKDQIIDFGVPVFPAKSFSFDILGEVTFTLYENTEGNINPGNIPGSSEMPGMHDAG